MKFKMFVTFPHASEHRTVGVCRDLGMKIVWKRFFYTHNTKIPARIFAPVTVVAVEFSLHFKRDLRGFSIAWERWGSFQDQIFEFHSNKVFICTSANHKKKTPSEDEKHEELELMDDKCQRERERDASRRFLASFFIVGLSLVAGVWERVRHLRHLEVKEIIHKDKVCWFDDDDEWVRGYLMASNQFSSLLDFNNWHTPLERGCSQWI